MELLTDVGWQQAAAKPIAGAHSIWEIVLHVAVWAGVALRRVGGETVEPTPAEDWPEVTDAAEDSWRDSVRTLVQRQEALADLTATLTAEQLEADAAGKDDSVYFLLHGVVQHNLYHAGQIALLKKT